jgi:hypothetical protein
MRPQPVPGRGALADIHVRAAGQDLGRRRGQRIVHGRSRETDELDGILDAAAGQAGAQRERGRGRRIGVILALSHGRLQTVGCGQAARWCLQTPAAAVLAGIATTWRIWSCSRQKRKFRCGSVENHGYRASAYSSISVAKLQWRQVFRAWPSSAGFGPTSPPDVLAMRDAGVTSRLTPRSQRACRQYSKLSVTSGYQASRITRAQEGRLASSNPTSYQVSSCCRPPAGSGARPKRRQAGACIWIERDGGRT